ncbi:MAG TPA: imidazolonepropionase [Thermoplasmatales archaeon]|nr:imidazolonepropionase [Thermoplasmatales archaeon]
MSLLIKNIGELFDGYKVMKNTCIYIENGLIADIGKEREADEIIDAGNKFVMPGFVDCHTHTVFADYRDFEVEWKIEGLSYQEIAEKGGGISYTVEETRRASKERLKKEAMQRIKEMIAHGTTTLEIKSGYGLDKNSEIKMLEVIEELNRKMPIDIIPTFLAHAIPHDADAEEFTQEIVEEMIPEIGKRKLAKFCDVFCEKGYFSVEQSKKILMEAKKYGMLPKIHADEFTCMGCSRLAAEIKAASADHLLMTGEEEMRLLASAGVVATLLPATPFVLDEGYPDARSMIDNGVIVALATDMNPNCYTLNMQFVVQLACYKMRMKPLEALRAATLNAAKALKMDDSVGSIEAGKKADLLIMNVPSHTFIPYKIGVNLVEKVIKEGKTIYSK